MGISFIDNFSDENVGNGTGTLTLTAPSPPVSPVGSLTLFAVGFGPTGIDWFEVDSQGDVFAQSLFGGGPLLVNTAVHLPVAVFLEGSLLALLADSDGRDFLIDVFNPFNPFVESDVLAALHL